SPSGLTRLMGTTSHRRPPRPTTKATSPARKEKGKGMERAQRGGLGRDRAPRRTNNATRRGYGPSCVGPALRSAERRSTALAGMPPARYGRQLGGIHAPRSPARTATPPREDDAEGSCLRPLPQAHATALRVRRTAGRSRERR